MKLQNNGSGNGMGTGLSVCALLLLLVQCMCTAPCIKATADVVVLCGESQAGKTTFAEYWTGKNVGLRGDGSGQSVTNAVHAVATRDGQTIVLDTPGFLDTRLLWQTDDSIMEAITKQVLQYAPNSGSVRAVILVESLSADSQQVHRNLKRLQTAFGAHVLQSVIVIGSKADISEELFGDTRLSSVEKTCKQMGLPFLDFELVFDPNTYTRYQFEQMKATKLAQLTTLIANRQPLPWQRARDKQLQIRRQQQEWQLARARQNERARIEREMQERVRREQEERERERARIERELREAAKRTIMPLWRVYHWDEPFGTAHAMQEWLGRAKETKEQERIRNAHPMPEWLRRMAGMW